jgi:ferritin-like protein
VGKLGQEIVQLDKAALLRELNRAYSDEWCGHYNYLYVANTLCGPGSFEVVQFMRRKSDRALYQATRFALRINELGGHPVAKLKDVLATATDKPFKLPASVKDVEGMVKAVLDAERTAIQSYKGLYERTLNKDLVTLQLVVECLTHSVQDEDRLERFLADSAPEMTGR